MNTAHALLQALHDDPADETSWLVLGDWLLAWSPAGYRERRPRPRGEWATVLTPASTVDVLRAGYVPEVHPSAFPP